MSLFVRIAFCVCLSCLFAACHRPTAYFQRTPHAASRLPIEQSVGVTQAPALDSLIEDAQPVSALPERSTPAMASREKQPTAEPTKAQIEHRIQRIQSLLAMPSATLDKQPRPKPKPKKQLRLGNRIRESLGMPLREELNWWQRISWKLKASVIVILIALLFAILHVTILAIIFGVVGAFLLLSGLRRSFKTRRPWF